jgi:outer membrane lipoprotein-sorting protein
MLPTLLVVMALGLEPDPVTAALARVEQVNAYQLILRSQGDSGEEVIRYSYQRPGFIRMDMVTPYRGAVLIYSPETDQVQLWPFGASGRRPGVTLSPLNRLVRSARGHRVDQSDLATLLRNVLRLQQQGELHQLDETTVQGRRAVPLVVEGQEGHRVGEVARYELWLDSETLFPLQVISRDEQGARLEAVRMEELVIDPEWPPDHFSP